MHIVRRKEEWEERARKKREKAAKIQARNRIEEEIKKELLQLEDNRNWKEEWKHSSFFIEK